MRPAHQREPARLLTIEILDPDVLLIPQIARVRLLHDRDHYPVREDKHLLALGVFLAVAGDDVDPELGAPVRREVHVRLVHAPVQLRLATAAQEEGAAAYPVGALRRVADEVEGAAARLAVVEEGRAQRVAEVFCQPCGLDFVGGVPYFFF